jgi:hypothetical protein
MTQTASSCVVHPETGASRSTRRSAPPQRWTAPRHDWELAGCRSILRVPDHLSPKLDSIALVSIDVQRSLVDGEPYDRADRLADAAGAGGDEDRAAVGGMAFLGLLERDDGQVVQRRAAAAGWTRGR